jgi:branched-chain amino acid aminotransferase
MAFVPIDDRDGWIWFDGEFVPWREARVHVLTHALHYASSVFEGERMYNGQIFKLTEHTNRFFRSAEVLDFSIPFTVAQINDACKETCARNGLADAYVRPLAWRGSEQVSVPAQNTTVHVAIAA